MTYPVCHKDHEKTPFERISLLDPTYNILSFRLTIPKGSKFKKTLRNFEIFCDLHSHQYVLYQEVSKGKKKPHYHGLIYVKFQKSTLYRKRDQHFPELKGNKMLAFKKVYSSGVLLSECVVKAHTYIAKEGNLVFQKGYTNAEIQSCIAKGSHIHELKDKPIYVQIICFYKIHNLTYEEVGKYIIEYYTKHLKKLHLSRSLFITLLHKIQQATNDKIKQEYHKSLLQIATDLDQPGHVVYDQFGRLIQ